MRTKRPIVCMFLLCFACVPQAMAGPLIGATLDAIYDIDPITGVASNLRATGGRTFEIAFADGILYGTTGNILSILDAASGESQLLGTITGLEVFEPIRDLTWNTQTGTLFALAHLGGTPIDRLYTIDTSALAATFIGELDAQYTTIAFDASGALYAISPSLDVISLIDPTTAGTLASTSLTEDIQSGTMVFAEMDQLIVSARIAGDTGFVFNLNPSDGTLSDIGRTGLDVGLTSLAYIPEPSTCCLVLFGFLWYFVRRCA